MSLHQAHIEQLAGSDRGRRVLAILAALQREVECCDVFNSVAVDRIVSTMTHQKMNATMRDALAPYREKPEDCFAVIGHRAGQPDVALCFEGYTQDDAIREAREILNLGQPHVVPYVSLVLRSSKPIYRCEPS